MTDGKPRLRVGQHARILRTYDEDRFKVGRIMAVERISDDGRAAYLYDLTTPMVHGYASLPQFDVADLEPVD